jgi:hypothetical protein
VYFSKKLKMFDMKNLFAIIIGTVLFANTKMYAQITLDMEVDSMYLGYQFKIVQISPTESKYFFSDTIANTFSLYNMDMSPFLTSIAVPEPFALWTTAFQVLYISRDLFDCDSSTIEYAYTSPRSHNVPFRVMRTDGTVLFYSDSTNCPYAYGEQLGGSDWIKPIVSTSVGTKLFLQKYRNGNLQIQNYQVFVYSLCGTLPTEVFDFSNQYQSFIRVFPNPTSSSLTFDVNLPDNMNEYELVILNNNASQVRREKISSLSAKYTINVEELSSGTYFYSLCTKNKSCQQGKFTLIK